MVTSPSIVLTVVITIGLFAVGGLSGTVYLCRTSSNPNLVNAAVKMIQTDPSSAIAAMQLLRTDSAVIAIVSGLTGVALGYLGGLLTNARTQYAAHAGPAHDHPLPTVRTDTPPGEAVAVSAVAPAAEDS